ncbi:MAG: hypothetical protein QXJ17_07605 [Nitrososphaeria archaeon]
MNWSKAFWKGFLIFLWTVLWSIVGLLVFFLLSSSLLAGMLSIIEDPQEIINNPEIASQLAMQFIGPIMLITILVTAFVGIATYATLVKIISETVAEEIKSSNIKVLPIPPPPPPPIPNAKDDVANREKGA